MPPLKTPQATHHSNWTEPVSATQCWRSGAGHCAASLCVSAQVTLADKVLIGTASVPADALSSSCGNIANVERTVHQLLVGALSGSYRRIADDWLRLRALSSSCRHSGHHARPAEGVCPAKQPPEQHRCAQRSAGCGFSEGKSMPCVPGRLFPLLPWGASPLRPCPSSGASPEVPSPHQEAPLSLHSILTA